MDRPKSVLAVHQLERVDATASAVTTHTERDIMFEIRIHVDGSIYTLDTLVPSRDVDSKLDFLRRNVPDADHIEAVRSFAS